MEARLVVRGSDDLDGVALLEDDHRLLVLRRHAHGVPAALDLLRRAQRVDAQHLDLEQLFDRQTDLDLVGVDRHAEVVGVAPSTVVGALLGQQGLLDHLVETRLGGHAAPAFLVFATRSAIACSAASSASTIVASSTSSAFTSAATRTLTPVKL